MLNQKLLSICIPTRGRVSILEMTLDSIFNSKVELSEYEVIIYDSSDNDELSDLIALKYNYPNLIHKKGKNNGFYNLISALELGNGKFLKLHNYYTSFYEHSLEIMLQCIKADLLGQSVLFFSNGSLKMKTIKSFGSFDDFLYEISYFSSWSTAFGIWKSDFDKVKNFELNPMFPHTSLLFKLYGKKSYLVNDEELFENQDVSKKGGYNLFETFAVTYLKMVENLLIEKQISTKTFDFIKSNLYHKFLIEWYFLTKIQRNEYTFDLSNIKKSMLVYYSALLYYRMVLIAYFRAFKNLVKITLNLRRL